MELCKFILVSRVEFFLNRFGRKLGARLDSDLYVCCLAFYHISNVWPIELLDETFCGCILAATGNNSCSSILQFAKVCKLVSPQLPQIEQQ